MNMKLIITGAVLLLALIIFAVLSKKAGTTYDASTKELYRIEDSIPGGFDSVDPLADPAEQTGLAAR